MGRRILSFSSRFFDVNWEPLKRELKDKILLPILGDYYGRVLENGEIRLAFDAGTFSAAYYDHALPIAARTYPLILEHGAESLGRELGKEHDDFLECLSIVKAFRGLPERTESA